MVDDNIVDDPEILKEVIKDVAPHEEYRRFREMHDFDKRYQAAKREKRLVEDELIDNLNYIRSSNANLRI